MSKGAALYYLLFPLAVLTGWWIFCLPDPLFDTTYSTVLLDRNGQLLGARLAEDGQWRFPEKDLVLPETFKKAIVHFEDKRFYKHNGVDLIALIRALRDNIKAGQVISGGSTLSMQAMRLARGNAKRNILQKAIEMVWALRAEWRYSKDEILRLYAGHAPFGGNVVGLSAASWRYFQKTPGLLSWGEAATLAVLPNAPGLIHPGRNRQALLVKRNFLLRKLEAKGIIDKDEASLAVLEPLPDEPIPLPDLAPHLLGHYREEGITLYSTIELDIQTRLDELLQRHVNILSLNGVNNAALMLMETESGNVTAYIGNAFDDHKAHQNDVDIITSERSSGSILKPFLYCAALEEGIITPSGIVEDVPTFIRGYQPLNFSQEYMGMVPAGQALSMSLNVPAVRLLREYGILPFKEKLQRAGITTLHFSPDHYGLPLVLGGAEVTLWDLCGAYASMGRILNHFLPYGNRYAKDDVRAPSLFQKRDKEKIDSALTNEWKNHLVEDPPVWNAGAIWHTFEAMSTLRRPDQEGQWELFNSSRKIAWKTGTSFGYRDAWAVGVTPRYTIGVWVGNADGEGRPGVIGLNAAAPMLFDVLRMLDDDSEWWYTPYEALQPAVVCSESGWLAGPMCDQADTTFVVKANHVPSVCEYHDAFYTDGTNRFAPPCMTGEASLTRYFVVPAMAETYYKRYNPSYRQVPPLHPGCRHEAQWQNDLVIVYPRNGSRIYVPYEWDYQKSKAVFSAVHRSHTAHVYWHLDKKYVGRTKEFHQIEVDPLPGKHELVLQDESGSMVHVEFEVLEGR